MKNQLEALASIKEQFIPAMQKCFGEGLLSIMLYGSAAGTGYHPGTSDINLIALIQSPDPLAIIKLGKEEAKYIRKNRISLQIQTADEFLGSTDVFPMEYLDMIDRRELLFGIDYFEKITVNSAHLRHQVEERLRGSVNALRQSLLICKGSEKQLSAVLSEWLGVQTALLRALLRLKKEEHIPFGADALAGVVADVYGIDGTPFSMLSALRDGGKKAPSPIDTASRVLVALTELSLIVDRMEV
jgi:predicted nucleotidyltransferase